MANERTITAWVKRTGERALGLWRGIVEFYLFVGTIVRSLKSFRFIRFRSVSRIILNQTRFTGIDALSFVLFIALVVGGTSIIQAMTNLPRFGIEGYLGNVLIIIIARELGPLVTALIVISRSGSAIATEIAVQKWSREILSMELMGIDPSLYIVFPRIIASILSIFSLIIFFDIVAFFGGYLISLTTIYIPMDVFFQNLLHSYTLKDMLSTVIKSFFFGMLIPLIACYYGLKPESKFEIPIYVSRAVSRTLFAAIIINAIVSVFFYF